MKARKSGMTGAELRELRVKAKMGQTEAARRLGLNQGTLSRTENRATVPKPVAILARIVLKELPPEHLEELNEIVDDLWDHEI